MSTRRGSEEEDEDELDDEESDADEAADGSAEESDDEDDDGDEDDDADEDGESAEPAAEESTSPPADAAPAPAPVAAEPVEPVAPVAAPKSGHAALVELWNEIAKTGGIDGWVTAGLNKKGLAVERVDASAMAGKELDDYKKALKAEAAERRALKRQAWKAYRANHIVNLGEGVHWQDADSAPPPEPGRAKPRRGAQPKPVGDRRDLPDAEERAAENGLPPLDTPQQLADALKLTIPELRWMAYHRDAATRIHYRRFTIPKRDGTSRPIWAPLPKLKAAQRWIARNIVERLPVHGSCHGFMAGRSTLTNAAAHGSSDIVVKLDIRGFFPTVTLPRVKGVFRKAGYRDRIATLLALLCTEAPREEVRHEGKRFFVSLGPRCLPQGAPTSPSLTNTLCLRLDRRITGVAAKSGWRYTRYADDLTFSLPADRKGPPQTGRLLGAVRAIVEAEGFAVHPEKTRVARSGGRQRVTGLVVNGDRPPRVPREIRRRLRAAICNLKHGKPLRNGDTPATLAGMAAYIHMADPRLGAELSAALRAAQ